LAKELGMTVHQLLNNVDSYELTEWIAFAKMEIDAEETQEEDETDVGKADLNTQLNFMPFSVNQKSKVEFELQKRADKIKRERGIE
jgi:hypothetical protein